MEPITGVISANNVAWEYVDEEICPTCEEWKAEIEEIRDCPNCNIALENFEGVLECIDCEYSPQNELENLECFDHSKLIGDWTKDKEGLYEPNKRGEFAAIVTSSSFNCVQVVWSKYTTNVRAMCSPCFPGQADLDSGAGNIVAYTLPDELLANQEVIDIDVE